MKKMVFKINFFCLLAIAILYSCSSSDSSDGDTQETPPVRVITPPETPAVEVPNSIDDLNLVSPTVDANAPGIGTVQNITPTQLVANMTAGWNLGNYFDVPFENKSQWGNSEPSRELIEKVSETGFNTIRIPVTWRTHQQNSPPYQIDETYLERVKRVVDLAMENDMYILLNTHHDTEVFQPKASTEAIVSERLQNTWLQIATYFEAYNEKLLFEVLNEPRVQGNNQEWVAGNSTTRRVLNNLHKVGVDAIRSTGGNNVNRQIVISTWAGKTNNTAMDALVIPNDDPNIIITVHAYTPFDVSHDGVRPWNGNGDLNTLRNDLDNVRRKWIVENNRAVILGEWAMVNDNPQSGRSTTEQARADYSAIYVREATARGMPTILWDDNGWFRALNRETLEWDSQGQADAIINNAQ